VRATTLRYPRKPQGRRERVYDLTVDGGDPSFVVGMAVVHNCHRIGQDAQVLVQHLVLEGSLDVNLARAMVEKQAVADAALDDRPADTPDDRETALTALIAQVEEDVAAAAARKARVTRISDFGRGWTLEERAEAKVQQRSATAGYTTEQITTIGATMTAAQVAAVQQALRLLAGRDSDRAQVRNEIGFNKADGYLGHLLALREGLTPAQAAVGRLLAHKYGQTQLEPGLVIAMGPYAG
jgi:hypothetical protein